MTVIVRRERHVPRVNVIPRLDRGISRGTVLEQIPRSSRGMTG